jgi:Zn finger protein HypA/HybF involved in hydrogenase expression
MDEAQDMAKKIIDEKVLCKCGKEPYLNSTSAHNEVHYVMRCPKCGEKGASQTRSSMMAISAWESRDWKK